MSALNEPIAIENAAKKTAKPPRPMSGTQVNNVAKQAIVVEFAAGLINENPEHRDAILSKLAHKLVLRETAKMAENPPTAASLWMTAVQRILSYDDRLQRENDGAVWVTAEKTQTLCREKFSEFANPPKKARKVAASRDREAEKRAELANFAASLQAERDAILGIGSNDAS